MKETREPPPGYNGRPVILVHLRVREDSDIAWCANVPYWPTTGEAYPGIPLLVCPVCAKAGLRE